MQKMTENASKRAKTRINRCLREKPPQRPPQALLRLKTAFVRPPTALLRPAANRNAAAARRAPTAARFQKKKKKRERERSMARTYMHKGHNKVFLHSRIISMKTGRKSESFTRNQKSESSRIKIKLRSSRTNQHQPGRVTNIQQRTESDNTRQTKCKKSLKNLSPPGRWPPTTRWRLRRSLLLHMSNRGAGHRQGTLKATSHQVNMSRPIRGYLQKRKPSLSENREKAETKAISDRTYQARILWKRRKMGRIPLRDDIRRDALCTHWDAVPKPVLRG